MAPRLDIQRVDLAGVTREHLQAAAEPEIVEESPFTSAIYAPPLDAGPRGVGPGFRFSQAPPRGFASAPRRSLSTHNPLLCRNHRENPLTGSDPANAFGPDRALLVPVCSVTRSRLPLPPPRKTKTGPDPAKPPESARRPASANRPLPTATRCGPIARGMGRGLSCFPRRFPRSAGATRESPSPDWFSPNRRFRW